MTARKSLAHSVTMWGNAALLAAFPFADQIMRSVSDNLPALSPYLPPNVYKSVGLAVVVYNIVHTARAARAANKPAQEAP